MADETSIKVAKITATQAIIVALITTIGGVMGGVFIGKSSKSVESVKQRWLHIHNVETSSPVVRIVASVNGINYSYPSKAIWAEVGPTMSEEKFPLLYEADAYRISFSAFISDSADEIGENISQHVEEIKINRLPTGKMVYELYPLSSGSRSAIPKLKVYYSVN